MTKQILTGGQTGGRSEVAGHVPDTRQVWVVHMPLEGIPSREGLPAATNHQSAPKHVRPRLFILCVRHAHLDSNSVQVSPVYSNTTALPPIRAIVRLYVPLEIRAAGVFLNEIAPLNGATEAGFARHPDAFALYIPRGVVALV